MFVLQKRLNLFAAFTLATLLAGCVSGSSNKWSTSIYSSPSEVKTDYVEPTTEMKFVSVPGGSFMMGETGKSKEDVPVHEVTLNGFYVGILEVTFNEYDTFCKATGRPLPDDEGFGRGQRPVINVSREEANAFIDWLTQQNGIPFSLPSEAQWEYFARAGTTTSYWTGNKLTPGSANCWNCGSQRDNKRGTVPVGSFPPNPWGIYDTAGNAAEWTLDNLSQQRNYVGAPSDGSAWTPTPSQDKVYRGGSWLDKAIQARSAARDWGGVDYKYKRLGFRLIIEDLPPQEKPAK